MNILLYIIIFIMGSLFGSFLTLATYRIPLKQNITHKRSYCPKCNHKLSFLDMFPIISYIFLKGKCRYCKSKIGSRYFIIEILSGIAFVILAVLLNINIYNIRIEQIAEFGFGVLYIVFLFLIAGIDKERHKINKGVLIYGIAISISYMLYQFASAEFNTNRFILYLVIVAIILLLSIYQMQKKGKDEYELSILIVCIIMCFFTYEVATIFSIIITILIIGIKIIVNKILNKGKKYKINIENQPIAFYLCIANCLTVLFAYTLYLLY